MKILEIEGGGRRHQARLPGKLAYVTEELVGISKGSLTGESPLNPKCPHIELKKGNKIQNRRERCGEKEEEVLRLLGETNGVQDK
jgi:hypothetical protein